MHLGRDGTFDDVIWQEVGREYQTMPQSFVAGEVVLDVGCHTGAVADLAARRGATVVAYEASRENCELARFNLSRHSSVALHHAAIWRSDVDEPTRLVFTPHADSANTGGGSVLFTSAPDHWSARPSEGVDPAPDAVRLRSQLVDAVPLDRVLVELGRVRYLKLDVEGAEFPILLTATRLDLVDAIAGEYHEFDDAAMALLAPSARLGTERYTVELLDRRLRSAGFATGFVPDRHSRGLFTAERVTPAAGS